MLILMGLGCFVQSLFYSNYFFDYYFSTKNIIVGNKKEQVFPTLKRAILGLFF